MAYYLQLAVLTDEGRKKFEENPEWINEVNKDIELMGAKILVQYGLLGEYDFVNIIETPSDEAAAKISIKLAAKGELRPKTLAAIPLKSLIESLKKERRQAW
ncbi:MAG: GYD domain-containing protein [Chloroflexota bacterium]